LKSGWYFAAKQAGVSKYIPVWITRHPKALGMGKDDTKNIIRPSITLTNYIADRDRITTKFKSVQKAIDIQEKNMRLVIQRIVKRGTRRYSSRK
jgi:hypothetical protein